MVEIRSYPAPPQGKTAPRHYSRAEQIADTVLHVTGVIAALVAVPVMVTLAAVWYGDASTIGAALIYGASLIAMLTFSACYHMAQHGRAKQILRRLDHAAIYVKIAGSYTPFAVLLAGDAAPALLAALWGRATVGRGV